MATRRVRGSDLTFNLPDDQDVVNRPVLRRIDPRYEYWNCEQAIRNPPVTGPLMGSDVSGGAVSTTFLTGTKGPGGGDIGPSVSVSTGTTATGRAHWGLGSGAIVHNFNADYEFIFWRGLVYVVELSDVAEEFDVWMGFGDTVTGAVTTDGAQFVYNRDGLGINWFAQNRGGGAGAAVDTGVPVTTSTAHEFVISWTPSGGMKYWIDGVVAVIITSNIPTPAQTFGAGIGILKSAGTTSRNVVVAYQEVYARWATPRGLALPAELQ